MKYFLLFLIILNVNYIYSLELKTKVDSIMMEGIRYYDAGDYNKSIEFYNKALDIEPSNPKVFAERGMSYFMLKEYKKSIEDCKKSLDIDNKKPSSVTVYNTLANSYDHDGQFEKAIKVFDEAISIFKDQNLLYLLYCNKGLVYYKKEITKSALECFEKSLILNPEHPDNHFYVANSLNYKNRTVAVLALTRFLILKPNSKNAVDIHDMLKRLVEYGVDKENHSINMNLKRNNDNNNEKNNFASVDFGMSLSTAENLMDTTNKSEIEKAINMYKLLFNNLIESEHKSGFYWDYYAPYFAQILEKNYVEIMTRIVNINSGSTLNTLWLENHKKEIDEFYKWSRNFKWYKD